MRIKIGDGKLFFDVDGAKLVPDGLKMRERPTVVLLHGGPGMDHSVFKPDLDRLAEIAQLVYLDLRSAGRSDRTSADLWTLDRWADDVLEFCEALEIEKPIVMGVSFGGMVAMAYASRHPDHPGKLILCSTYARARVDRMCRVFERLSGKEASDACRNFWETPGPQTAMQYMKVCTPHYARRPWGPEFGSRIIGNPQLQLAVSRDLLPKFDLIPVLSRIKCPTLVMGGEDDPVTTIEDAEDIAAAIPEQFVRFERFPNAGHTIVPDAPERFLRVVREFISA
ncbi:MAG TPA: alpha/beta hydrolase [Candidatus Binataceae bacterium]